MEDAFPATVVAGVFVLAGTPCCLVLMYLQQPGTRNLSRPDELSIIAARHEGV